MNNLNSKIESAMKDKDITRIMSKASARFRNQLDEDEIHTCHLNALWKSFVNFKPERKAKFTTYLYSGVFIECLKQVKFKNKYERKAVTLYDNMLCSDHESVLVDIFDELQNEEEKDLISDRICNMTINEIAKKNHVSRETIRKKIKKITERFKYKFN